MSRIAILTGGSGSEREVSLRSAKHIEEILRSYYEVTVFDFPKDREIFLLQRHLFSLAIPLIHGKGGEDGTLQGFLETLDIPYLFSGIQSHGIALDKEKTKILVEHHGIRIPKSITLRKGESTTYNHSVVVKPLDGGSSVATSIVHSQGELDRALEAAFAESEYVLVEDFIEGQEFTVAVIEENGQPMVLPVILIQSEQGLFDYASKYDPDHLAQEICPAPIAQDLSERLQEIARKAHLVLHCRHMSRTDIIVDRDGQAWFLEINTIPGMTQTSLVPKAITASGRTIANVFRNWFLEIKIKAKDTI